jgi:hypothetical protein
MDDSEKDIETNRPDRAKPSEDKITPEMIADFLRPLDEEPDPRDIPLPRGLQRARERAGYASSQESESSGSTRANQSVDDITPEMMAETFRPIVGESDPRDDPIPRGLQRARERAGYATSQEADSTQKGPERHIGPRNPEHPNVNRDGGGRTPS